MHDAPLPAHQAWGSTLRAHVQPQGKLPVVAADLVSPIFTMWLTLLLLYLSNCLADYTAAATLNAAYTDDLRQSERGLGLGEWGWGWARCCLGCVGSMPDG